MGGLVVGGARMDGDRFECSVKGREFLHEDTENASAAEKTMGFARIISPETSPKSLNEIRR